MQIRQKAKRVIELQSEILQGFRRNGDSNENSSTPLAGHLLSIGSMPNRTGGRRLFVNIAVLDRVTKFFGSEKQIAEALVAVGLHDLARQVRDGLVINSACRVITKRSADGKYLNVEQILPPVSGNGGAS